MLLANKEVAKCMENITNGDKLFLLELWLSAEQQGFAVYID